MVIGFISLVESGYGKVLYRIDFTEMSDISAKKWMKDNNVEFKRSADDVDLSFSKRGLEIATNEELNGVFVGHLNVEGGKSIHIEWGVDTYPDGANWEQNIYREAISVLVSFGEKKVDSGAFYIPDMPYFIGFFLGEKEKEGKAYVGNYYKKGGRYLCVPCNRPAGEMVKTVYHFEEPFKKFFSVEKVPPISYFALEVDTRDTSGISRAFIKSIEVHDE